MKLTKETLKRLIKEELSAIQEMEEDDFDTMSREVHEEVARVVAMMKQELSKYSEGDSIEDLANIIDLGGRLEYLYDIYIPGDDETDSAMKGYSMKKYRKSFSPLGHIDPSFD
jgi:hypothetical protein